MNGASPTTARLREMVVGRLDQLRQGERSAPETLAERQGLALAALAEHAQRFAPGFAARLNSAGLAPGDLRDERGFRALAPLTRRELQDGDGTFSRAIPETHGPTSWVETTGSTGQPVRAMHTRVTQVEWQALTLLEHGWHASDFSRPLAAMRANIDRVERLSHWGSAVRLVSESGPSVLIPGTMPVTEVAAMLRELAPGQLVIYPTMLATLCDHIEQSGETLPPMQRIRTIGEMLHPERRERASALLGAPVTDVYSSRELGQIAIECPESGLYHVPEGLIVEVLDDGGQPCGEGQEGRVVITGLRNYATPLIRYAIGDRAIRGGACPCGRSWPTLRRVMGRERNMVRMPDGARAFPPLASQAFWQHGPVTQFQFIQHGADDIEVRLAVRRAMTREEEQTMARAVHQTLGHSFALRFSYFDEALPPAPGGKREEFVCLC